MLQGEVPKERHGHGVEELDLPQQIELGSAAVAGCDLWYLKNIVLKEMCGAQCDAQDELYQADARGASRFTRMTHKESEYTTTPIE